MNPLPSDFKEMLYDLLGEEARQLISELDNKPVTSVRINRRKPVAEFTDAEKVPWCDSGFYLEKRPEFIFDPLLHAGAYYVQEASSMIYEEVTKRIIEVLEKELNCAAGGKVKINLLDLCAAPGGKTTAMINALPDGSEITANEYSPKRVGALKENLEKWGYRFTTVTNKDSSYYANTGKTYDIVAVDAPCSGEGMMRKEEVARTQWSRELVQKCSTLQREILENAVKCVKPGGFLIYSTCTFNRCENEENAEYIANVLGLEPFDLDLPAEWQIQKGIGTDLPVYRFMPHRTKGEGLFLSVFRKPGEWLPSKFIHKPVSEGNSELPMVEVDKDTAIKYLRGESIVLDPEAPKGMLKICYMGLPLGEAKNIGTRANNHYPKSWRIRKG